jgi:RNA polymerase sigma-70 factor (ECF subfamily)
MRTAVAVLETDHEILEAFRSGLQEQAITAFVRRHQKFVYSVALRYLSSPEDARDCAQDVMIKAYQGLGRFRGESSLQTWIGKIARNTAISMFHKRKLVRLFAPGEAEGERDVPARQLSPAEHAEQNEFERFFRTVLSTIPPKQRETFMMRYYEELSYEEISAQVGTSVGALKANYHWAVKKIAEKLKGTDYYEKWSKQHE